MKSTEQFWTSRYESASTGWDIGYPSTPIKAYFDQVKNRDLKILIPGAGRGYEAEYLFKEGFTNVFVLDISELPLRDIGERVPDFPKEQLIQGDFFAHEGTYDIIVEQTFFCSFPPTKESRQAYAKKMHELLAPNGKLVGLWFDVPLTGDMEKRPFGGTREEYLRYFEPYFKVKIFDACHNSIPPRVGNELFGIFTKKKYNIKFSSKNNY